MSEFEPEQKTNVRELSSRQRRVLGALLEKAFTTPEYYPMTLKALTAACNQKSNRAPVVNYDEETVEETIDELRQLGLAALIHSDTGRTERYRHYMRKQFSFSEPQLAIMTELLLRGRQTLGELRGRASRMVPFEDLASLRTEVAGLINDGFMQTSGSLERRGIEVDHDLYPAGETQPLGGPSQVTAAGDAGTADSRSQISTGKAPDSSSSTAVEELAAQNRLIQSEVDELRQEVAELRERLTDLERQLGG